MPWIPLTPAKEEIDAFARVYRKQARFYVDESVDVLAHDALQAFRCRFKTYAQFGLKGRQDEDHFSVCWREGYILLTQDKDFLDPKRFPDHRNPGVVVIDATSEAEIIRAIYFLSVIIQPHVENWRGTRVLISHAGEISVWSRNVASGAVQRTRYRWCRNQPPEMWVAG